MINNPRFIILSGDGINCERETREAFILSGGDADIYHINEVIDNPSILKNYDGMAIPGGFSFGDELGSGQLLALKIKYQLADAFREFVAMKKPIIGICNGFQVLVKLGLLPYSNGNKILTLTNNISGQFIDKWVNLDVDAKNICAWASDLNDKIELPIRHGEGRVVFKDNADYQKLKDNGQIVFEYDEDVNGAYKNIAGICDETGLILGMMPHPEAYVSNVTYKNQSKSGDIFGKGDGLFLFENIIKYLKSGEIKKYA